MRVCRPVRAQRVCWADWDPCPARGGRRWAEATGALSVETGEAIMGLWAGNQHETLKFVSQKSGLGPGRVAPLVEVPS